jgi:hypothetical protein
MNGLLPLFVFRWGFLNHEPPDFVQAKLIVRSDLWSVAFREHHETRAEINRRDRRFSALT